MKALVNKNPNLLFHHLQPRSGRKICNRMQGEAAAYGYEQSPKPPQPRTGAVVA